MTISPIPQTLVNVPGIKSTEKQTNTVLNWCARNWRGILSELISTMLLLTVGCLSNVPIDGVPQNPAYGAFGFGLVVMINVQIFGHISGAYMNPAVTLAAVIWGSVPVVLGIVYVVTQCVAAILGYGIFMTLSTVDAVAEGVCLTLPHPNLNDYQALGIEIAITAALSLINCGIWDPINKNRQDSSSIKFGLTIVGLSLAGGPLTGASMNPARTLGPVVWSGNWTSHWVYWVGPLIGGGVPAVFYKYVWLNKNVPSES